MTPEKYQEILVDLMKANAEYYADGSSSMSDAEYDVLYYQVNDYEAKNGIKSVLTTQVAGGTSAGTTKHSSPMLSLGNEYTPDDTEAWALKRCQDIGSDIFTTWLSVEPKVDGSAVAIRYSDHKPVQMLTRGDGVHGEDISHNLDLITNIPKVCAANGNFEVRGEVVMTNSQFVDACEERMDLGKDTFKNPRNACAGILGTDAQHRTLHNVELTFICYDVVGDNGTFTYENYIKALSLLVNVGFTTAPSFMSQPVSINNVAKAVSAIERLRPDFDFEIDGAVVKFADYDVRGALGANSRAPRWATAYKFPNIITTSVVEDIETAVGKTGRITFRARIQPVDLMGTTVTYATLHNLDFIAEHNIGIGSTVQVERAADVIPRVTKGQGGTPYDPPDWCPKCGGALVQESMQLMCKSDACNLPAWIKYAVSRDALDCDGAGGALIEKVLAKYSTVNNLYDFFALDLADIKAIDGYGGVAGDNAHSALQSALAQPLDRLLVALALPMTGRSMSRRIAQHFGTLDAIRSATVEDLAQVDKIGTKKAQAVRDRLDELDNMLEDLEDLGFTTTAQAATKQPESIVKTSLSGKTVYVTGKILIKKSEAEAKIKAMGGRWTKTGTPQVIIGNKSSKLDRMVARGAIHMTEKEFLAEAAKVK